MTRKLGKEDAKLANRLLQELWANPYSLKSGNVKCFCCFFSYLMAVWVSQCLSHVLF